MKTRYKGLAVGIAVGVGFWVLDSALDFLVFYRGQGSFLDLLILKVPPHEIYVRSVAILMVLVFSLIAANYAAQYTAPEKRLYRGKGKSKVAGLIFLKVVGITFVCEVVVMAFLHWRGPVGRSWIILDAFLLTALSAPFLYALIVKPVYRLLQEREQSEEQIRAANQQLRASEQQLNASNQQLRANGQQLRAANQQLQATEQQLRAANQQLDAGNQQLRASEEELRKVNHDLEDRVKELHCLYELSQLVERPGTTVEEIFQGLVELIPAAWEYSDITAARVVFEKQRFKTGNFRKTAWLQSADIKVHGKKAGTIEVCYLRKKPAIDEGPFLKEERNLLNVLAERLGHIAERKHSEEEIKAADQQLRASNQQLQANEQQLQAANQQLRAIEQQLRAANHQLEADIAERKKAEARLRGYRRRLRELASELVLAEERLRRRIARDLHDDVGQDLLSVKMRLAELGKGIASAKQSAALEGILKSITKTIQNTRSLLFDLSPPVLYELGFEPAVEWLTEKLQADHDIAAVFEDDGQAKVLADDLRIGLFRAVRELLVNIVKHAQAKKVKVSARRDGPNICVEVEDDGVGFDVEQIQIPGDLSNGFGLFDIRERLHHFGGSFQLESKPSGGTRVTLRAPLQ